MRRFPAAAQFIALAALLAALAPGARRTHAQEPPKGQRVFSAGHSFHMPMPGPLDQIAKAAKVEGHKVAGTQGLGGSTVKQHWDLADDKDKARKALKAGGVDVLTLSPHLMVPDEGIDNFVALMVEHNPKGRVTIQASWYPFDLPANLGNKNFKNADRDAADTPTLRKAWTPWVEKMRDQAKALNEKHKKTVVFVVPVGEAVIRLRERVTKGEVPGYAKQSELFTDEIGHGKPPIGWLTAYCHFAVIYGRSPVGIPTPEQLKKAAGEDADKLNTVLQEAAWDAVIAEPMSGVKAPAGKK